MILFCLPPESGGLGWDKSTFDQTSSDHIDAIIRHLNDKPAEKRKRRNAWKEKLGLDFNQYRMLDNGG